MSSGSPNAASQRNTLRFVGERTKGFEGLEGSVDCRLCPEDFLLINFQITVEIQCDAAGFLLHGCGPDFPAWPADP